MSIQIRKHSTSEGIYFVNDKQVIVDSNNNAISSEKLTNEEITFFNEYLKVFRDNKRKDKK